MNNPKTIEAIKVLYRGDIDDVCERDVLRVGNRVYRRTVYPREIMFGSGKHTNTELYELVRALCLQEPTSDEHPLHAGYVLIDGQKRELRFIGENAACGHCGGWSKDSFGRVCKCDTDCFLIEDSGGVTHSVWYHKTPPPAPVKEPELDEFEKWAEVRIIDDSYTLHYRDGIEMALKKYRQIKQQGAH